MKTALILHGGWEGHQPRECAEFFADQLRGHGLAVTLSDRLSVLDDDAAVQAYSLIVPIWTMGTLTPSQENSLVKAVLGGVGLAGFHGGMADAFRGSIAYQWMTGGQFLSHPDNIKTYTVRVTCRDDPILHGIDDFTVHTEQYYLLLDPRNEVLAETTHHSASAPWTNGVVMPVVWKKRHGQGRVFYSALGHRLQEFLDCPPQRELTVRGMLWAAR